MKRKDWLALAGFAALVLALRFSSAPRTVLDWDESSMLLMGRSLLRGEAPYLTAWDHSPLGTPILFALAQVVFGEAVISIRILSWLLVTATCFALYRLGERLGRSSTGWIAGLLYAVLTLNNGGLAVHRELLFAPFAVTALWLILSAPTQARGSARAVAWRYLLAGLLLGFGIQIKFLYGLDGIAIGLIALWHLWPAPPPNLATLIRRTLGYGALLLVGPLLLLGLTAGYAALKGSLDEYLYANFVANSVYVTAYRWPREVFWREIVGQVTSQIPLWLSLALLPIYLIWARRSHGEAVRSGGQERRSVALLLIWLAAGMVGTFVSGKPWPHYYLNWLPPLSLLTGLLIAGLLRGETSAVSHAAGGVTADDNEPSALICVHTAPAGGCRCQRHLRSTLRVDVIKRGLVITLILGPLLLPIALPAVRSSARVAFHPFVRGAAYPQDGPAQVASYLSQRVGPDDSIYVTDYEPILYYLVDARAATRYVFPPVLLVLIYQQTGHIKALAELDRMMIQPPKYVIQTAGVLDHTSPHIDNWTFVAALAGYLSDRYTLEETLQLPDTFTGEPVKVELYRLTP